MNGNDYKRTLAFAIAVAIVLLAVCYKIFIGGRAVPASTVVNYMSEEVVLNEKKIQENSEYCKLKKGLDDRYFEQFCDIFDGAKKRLLSEGKVILGQEYEDAYEQLKTERRTLENMRVSFAESAEMVALKDELTLLKEKLIESGDEEERIKIRSEMDNLLKTIARKNIENFGAMSRKKSEIDELAKKLQTIAETKKDLIASAEKQLFTDAKIKFSELSAAYKEENEALAQTFGIEDYPRQLPFLDWVDLNMRLIDFDRVKLKEARERKTSGKSGCQACARSGCDGDCGERKNKFFTSSDNGGDKN